MDWLEMQLNKAYPLAMATDEQTHAIMEYRRAVADARDRKRQWPATADELKKILQARVAEFKNETDTTLILHDIGQHDGRSLELAFGANPAFRTEERAFVEYGAKLQIILALNGLVEFIAVEAVVEGGHASRERAGKHLGSEDPALAVSQLDSYLTRFLTHALETHWSRIER